MATADETEIEICFRVEVEYMWSGMLSDLPASARKGVLVKGEVDTDVLFDNVNDDTVMAKLMKNAEVQSEDFELQDANEV